MPGGNGAGPAGQRDKTFMARNKDQAQAQTPVEPAPAEQTPATGGDENSAAAAAAGAGATGEDDKVKRLAVHGYIAADGSVVEDIEKATGITYEDKATKETFAFNFAEHGATAGAVATMFAVFGAKTRATNAASAARQKRARDKSYTQSDVEYIREVFAETKVDQWAVAAEGGPRGPAIDLKLLHAAISEFAANSGKPLDPQKLEEKLAGDLAYRKGAYGNTAVREIYDRLAGKAAFDPLAL